MSSRDQAKRREDWALARRLARGLSLHARWSRERLRAFQRRRLRRLVRRAAARSGFYRELYRGIDLDGPWQLADLPAVPRGVIMEEFDRVVADRRLRLDALREHAAALEGDDYYLGRYRVLSSSGSSGRPGVFVFDRPEWSMVVASRLRAEAFGARMRASARTAWVVSPKFGHVSRRSGALEPESRSLFLDAAAPIPDIVARLNAFEPQALVAYSSAAAILAEEQAEGRLRIRPRSVTVGAELLTSRMAGRIEAAWGARPSLSYGLTECSCWGEGKPGHAGIHLFEDIGIMEVVDELGRPVPDGEPGRKVLLTNLYNLTQPLIRCEVSDVVAISKKSCSCGAPFRVIQELSGREEDILRLDAVLGGTVAVPPAHFRFAFEKFPAIAQYQVVQRGRALTLRLVVRSRAGRRRLVRGLEREFAARWRALGAKPPPLRVRFVSEIRREPSGKLKHIRARPQGGYFASAETS